jgi:hypothetical protein
MMARGQYLLRWIQVFNIMIYKKAGILELDELHVIHLFEAGLQPARRPNLWPSYHSQCRQ